MLRHHQQFQIAPGHCTAKEGCLLQLQEALRQGRRLGFCFFLRLSLQGLGFRGLRGLKV